MADTFSQTKRSEVMARISAKNTVPELVVRKILFGLGFRYRLHDNKLPGKPDVVLKKSKTTFFINGCFWHQHKGCKRQSVPKSNLDYWKPKLEGNIERQKRNIQELKKLGWKVYIVWECETKNKEKLYEKLKTIYEKNNSF